MNLQKFKGTTIQPFHTQDDGDILYAVTTEEYEPDNIERQHLGVLAAETVWDAILSIVDNTSPEIG